MCNLDQYLKVLLMMKISLFDYLFFLVIWFWSLFLMSRKGHLHHLCPVCLCCDDPCTYVAHSFARYPTESELAFGERRGCFEKPSDEVPPRSGISCPDITPIELQSGVVNREAMLNPSHLVHPDTTSSARYVFGTR